MLAEALPGIHSEKLALFVPGFLLGQDHDAGVEAKEAFSVPHPDIRVHHRIEKESDGDGNAVGTGFEIGAETRGPFREVVGGDGGPPSGREVPELVVVDGGEVFEQKGAVVLICGAKVRIFIGISKSDIKK